MKRYLAILLSVLFALSMVVGCAQPAAETPAAADAPAKAEEPAETAAEPVTIDFWWAPTFAEEEANRGWIDTALANFYTANPNVTVNFTLIPWSDYA